MKIIIRIGIMFVIVPIASFLIYSCGGGGDLGETSENVDEHENAEADDSAPEPFTAIQISTGSNHYLALTDNGTVWTWGTNISMGDAPAWTIAYSNIYSPVPMLDENGDELLDNVVYVKAIDYRSYVIKEDGTIYAWGYNQKGELGDGTIENRSLPVHLDVLEDIVAIEGYDDITVALKLDGTVVSWGRNYEGSLGQGINDDFVLMPSHVVGPKGEGYLDGVMDIAVGYSHSITLRTDGTVWTWGSSCSGELGIGIFREEDCGWFEWFCDDSCPYSNYPVQVLTPDGESFLTGVVDVAAGSAQSYAILEDGTVLEWGWVKSYGGDGYEKVPLPRSVLSPSGEMPLSGIVSITKGPYALTEDGYVLAWGSYVPMDECGNWIPEWETIPLPTLMENIEDIISVSANTVGAMVMKSDGTVWKWSCGSPGNVTPEQVFIEDWRSAIGY